jgi:hypothetical protein
VDPGDLLQVFRIQAACQRECELYLRHRVSE